MSVATFVAAWAAWKRSGEHGPAPQCRDHGDDILIGNCMDRLQEAEQKVLRDSGVPPEWSSWRVFDPDYIRPMREARRAATAAGKDPDEAARAFTRKYRKEHHL